jgi:hypothetical protein
MSGCYISLQMQWFGMQRPMQVKTSRAVGREMMIKSLNMQYLWLA